MHGGARHLLTGAAFLQAACAATTLALFSVVIAQAQPPVGNSLFAQVDVVRVA